MGGVLRIWAVPQTDISVSGNHVTILSDTNMVNIYIKEDSATFNEDEVKSFAGTAYKVDITAIVPCDTADTLKEIANMERHCKYLVIYMDGNGNYKLSGTSRFPLRFTAKATTSTGAAGLNHYSINFSGQQLKRAVFIDNPFA